MVLLIVKPSIKKGTLKVPFFMGWPQKIFEVRLLFWRQ